MIRPSFIPLHLPGNLPIFKQDHQTYALYYAPGYLAVVEAGCVPAFEDDLIGGARSRWPEVGALHKHASAAQQGRADIHARPFAPFTPLCLTLYLNNECNLHCIYCYSMPAAQMADRLALGTVQAAADLVAANCQAQNRPFTVVFHGGGEPTLHRDRVDAMLDSLEETARARGLSLFRYVATNGVLSPVRAAWLASRFDLIGLSCDGPADIQARQRPLRDGASSTPFVEHTAQIVHDLGKPVHVRVTVTADSFRRQAEIAEYLCQTIRPQEIHVEPVYRLGRASADPGTRDEPLCSADDFAAEFLRGRAAARRYGVRWLTSGSRPREIHGPYCQVFRDVLNLVPGGAATACFCITHAAQAPALTIGQMDGDGRFALDAARIQDLRARLLQESPECTACFNRYHCVRGCPETCPLDGSDGGTFGASFRCQVQQSLVNACLQETAAILRARPAPGPAVAGSMVADL